MLLQLPSRPDDAHKGAFGHVLIIGGSQSMPGAPALSGLAALRGGAGLVTIATSREAQPITAGFSPCLMTVPLPSEAGLISADVAVLRPWLDKVDVIAVGPGLGQSPSLRQLVARLYRDWPRPMVIDADGLNNLSAGRPGDQSKWSQHAGPRVLTPHPGEFRRMVPDYSGEVPFSSVAARDFAAQFAQQHQLILVLKGHRTLVTDGQTMHFNTTGNSGLATAGSGDVLTGLIAALIAQHLLPLSAAATACHLHGLAGDIATNSSSSIALIASDLIDHIQQAFAFFASSQAN